MVRLVRIVSGVVEGTFSSRNEETSRPWRGGTPRPWSYLFGMDAGFLLVLNACLMV
jgi:hypothetical protein